MAECQEYGPLPCTSWQRHNGSRSSEQRANEHSGHQSSVQYFCFLDCRQDLCLPKTCGSEPADSLTADSSAARIQASRTNVSNTRRHLCRNPFSVRISGSFRRPARRSAGSDRDSCFGKKRRERSVLGVGVQRRRNARPLRCYNSSDNLPGATSHGPSLLDSRILGSCVVGDALHHVRVPFEVLEETARSMI